MSQDNSKYFNLNMIDRTRQGIVFPDVFFASGTIQYLSFMISL